MQFGPTSANVKGDYTPLDTGGTRVLRWVRQAGATLISCFSQSAHRSFCEAQWKTAAANVFWQKGLVFGARMRHIAWIGKVSFLTTIIVISIALQQPAIAKFVIAVTEPHSKYTSEEVSVSNEAIKENVVCFQREHARTKIRQSRSEEILGKSLGFSLRRRDDSPRHCVSGSIGWRNCGWLPLIVFNEADFIIQLQDAGWGSTVVDDGKRERSKVVANLIDISYYSWINDFYRDEGGFQFGQSTFMNTPQVVSSLFQGPSEPSYSDGSEGRDDGSKSSNKHTISKGFSDFQRDEQNDVIRGAIIFFTCFGCLAYFGFKWAEHKDAQRQKPDTKQKPNKGSI
jgi:hypothetical protein